VLKPWWISGALLAGCFGSEPAPDYGSPADMTTAPGNYGAYRVVYPCPAPLGRTLGVIGLGAIAPTPAEFDQLRDELRHEVQDIASVWAAGGYGTCEAEGGTSIWLSDWREVDVLISRVGGWLAANHLAIEVAIEVEPVPVPAVAD
jgi:hypothetical protein